MKESMIADCEDRCQWLDEGEDTLGLLVMAKKETCPS